MTARLLQYGLGGQLGWRSIGEARPEFRRIASHGTLATGEYVNACGHARALDVFAAFMLLMPVGFSLLFTQVDVRHPFLCVVTLLSGTAALLATLSVPGGFGSAGHGRRAGPRQPRPPERMRQALRRRTVA